MRRDVIRSYIEKGCLVVINTNGRVEAYDSMTNQWLPIDEIEIAVEIEEIRGLYKEEE